jgi:hypothetical protein
MSTSTMKDGTTIYYKDWGKGPVVTFSHGWPLSADAWDGQMLFLAQHGFRVVAHHRRGHGRSSQASTGNDMDGYADDLAALIEELDLRDITMGPGWIRSDTRAHVSSRTNGRDPHDDRARHRPCRGRARVARRRMLPPPPDVRGDTAFRARVRGLRQDRRPLGAPAYVPDVRRHALL